METERVIAEAKVEGLPMVIESDDSNGKKPAVRPRPAPKKPEPAEKQEVISSEDPQELVAQGFEAECEEHFILPGWSEIKPKLGSIETRIKQEMVSIKKKVFLIGKLLVEAKDILGHGLYAKWIEERFRGDLPYSTAWMYAAVYKRFESDKELIDVLPLTVLADVRNYPLEIMKTIKQNPEEYKAIHNQVMGLYKGHKRGKMDLPEFVKGAQTAIKSASVRPIYEVWHDQAKPRIKENKEIYKTHIVGQLKNQLITVMKTIGELKGILTDDELAEARDSLISDIDLAYYALGEVRTLLSNNENLVAILDQIKSWPASPEKRTRSKHVKLRLSSNL